MRGGAGAANNEQTHTLCICQQRMGGIYDMRQWTFVLFYFWLVYWY